MATGLGRAVLELKTDSAQFFKDVDRVDSKFESLKQRIRGVSSDVGGASGNLDKFGRGLGGAASSADQFNGKIGTMLGGVRGLAGAFGVTLGAGAILGFAKSILSTADNIADLSQKMGISAEAAQRFTFAAKQGGADIEHVSKSIVEMNRNLAAPDKSTVAAFRAAGLSIDELRKKKPEDAFRDIVRAIEKIPHPAQQTEFAFKALGKSGVELLPAIRSGFLEIADGASVMSNETVQRLADAQQAWENFFNEVTILSGEFLADVMKNLGTAMSGFSKFFGDVKATTAGFFSGGFGGAGAAHAAYMDDLKKQQLQQIETEKTATKLKEAKEHLARTAKFAASATGELTDAQKKAAAAAEAHKKAIGDLVDEMSGAKLKQQVDRVNEAIAKLTEEQKKNPAVVAAMMKQIRPLVEAGGLPLLSKEAHAVFIAHSKLHDLLPKVNADLGAILEIGPKITLQYTEWKDTLAGMLDISAKLRAFTRSTISTNPLDILGDMTGGISDLGKAPGLVKSFFGNLQGSIADFGKSFAPTIMAAITGGGNVGASVTALVGQRLGSQLSSSFGGFLTKNLGKTIGGSLSSMLPGLATFAGPVIDKGIEKLLGTGIAGTSASWAAKGMMIAGPWGAAAGAIGGAIKGAFNRAANDTKKAREEFAKSIGFTDLGNLYAKLRTMGAEGEKLAHLGTAVVGKKDEAANRKWMEDVGAFLKKTEEDAKRLAVALDGAFGRLSTSMEQFGGKAPAALQPMIAELLKAKGLTDEHKKLLESFSGAPSWQTMASMAENLGVKLSSLGKGFQQARLDDIAMQYARAFVTFNDAGADMGAVLADATEKVQELVTDSLRAGTTLPAALEPWLRQMVEAGRLVDENGNKLENLDRFTFTGDVNDTFKEMKDILGEIRDLLANGLPNAAREGAAGIRDEFAGGVEVPVRWSFDRLNMPEVDVPHLASGGVVTRPTFAQVGEVPEAIIPLARLDELFRNGGAGGGQTINVTVAPVVQAWDVRDVDRWFRESGGPLVTDAVLRVLEKNDGGGMPVSPVARLQTVVGGP